MSEENAKCPPAGYHEIPRRAKSDVIDEAIGITAMILMFGVALFVFGVLFVVTWPWVLLVVLGPLNLFGVVVFVLLHRGKQ